jgi:hypothetical protein
MDVDMDLKRRQSINNTIVFPNITKNPHHRNLIDQIIFLYGRETLDEIHDLEKLSVKIKKRIVDLVFLKNYRNRNVLPKFVQIEHKARNRWNKSAFFNLGLSITENIFFE